MASSAASSSSKNSSPPLTLRLLDLPVDVLFLILKIYVPLKEKLHALFRIREFRRLVTDRAAYRVPAGRPFSRAYLRFLRCVRPGWYVARRDPSRRFHLQIDERTLHVSLRHYLLEGPPGGSGGSSRAFLASRDTLKFDFYKATLPHARSNLLDYLVEYHHCCTEGLDLATYRLRGQRGFITVDLTFVRHGLHQMRFHDGRSLMIHEERKVQLRETDGGPVHFSVLLTIRDRKLTVECLRRDCHRCDPRLQELYPIEFRETSTRGLIWDEGRIPLAARQDFRLLRRKKDEEDDRVLSGSIAYVEMEESSWRIQNKANERTEQQQRMRQLEKRKRERQQQQQQQQEEDYYRDQQPPRKK